MVHRSDKRSDLASLQIQPNPLSLGEVIKIGYFNAHQEQLVLEIRDVERALISDQKLSNAEVGLVEIESQKLGVGTFYFTIQGKRTCATRQVVIRSV